MVEILDYYELLAVHRALQELKWIEHPRDPAVIGSPYVAKFAHRVLDALIEIERGKGNHDAANAWKTWRQIDETRAEWNSIQRQIQLTLDWNQMDKKDKQHHVKNIASPFTITLDKINILVAEGDQFHSS